MMRGLVVLQSEQVSVCMVFNCLDCGVPLLTSPDGVHVIDRRAIGRCDECESQQGFDVNSYDPYGQVILEEVAA